MAKVIMTDDGGMVIVLSRAEVLCHAGVEEVTDRPGVVVPRPQQPTPAAPGTGLLSGFNAGEGPTTDQRTEGDQNFLDDVLKGNA